MLSISIKFQSTAVDLVLTPVMIALPPLGTPNVPIWLTSSVKPGRATLVVECASANVVVLMAVGIEIQEDERARRRENLILRDRILNERPPVPLVGASWLINRGPSGNLSSTRQSGKPSGGSRIEPGILPAPGVRQQTVAGQIVAARAECKFGLRIRIVKVELRKGDRKPQLDHFPFVQQIVGGFLYLKNTERLIDAGRRDNRKLARLVDRGDFQTR